jgi:hypothetical protein
MTPPKPEKEELSPSEISPDYHAELLSYQNRALLGMVLGILSIPAFACPLPIGLLAFFLGVQSQAGLLKLGVEEGQKRATLARRCGGVGAILFFINLILYFLQLKGFIKF